MTRARTPGPRTAHRQAGFTLIELMIVVLILGVLSALAIPAYSSYVYRARASEGAHMLGSIGSRQEAYYAEFGQYANVSQLPGYVRDWEGRASSFTPDASSIDGTGVVWPAVAANPFAADLGIRRTGRTYLAYACVAGAPGGINDIGMRPDEFWWVAAALADIDDDGNLLTIELTSQSRAPWFSSAKGYE